MKVSTRRLGFCAAAILSVIVVATVEAQSPYYQRPQGFRQPRRSSITSNRPSTFSPYLNLLRTSNSPVLNYYGLVRPEQEFREFNRLSQANQQQLEQSLRTRQNTPDDGSELGNSGHRAMFMSDLRGGAGSTVQTLRERDGRLNGLPQAPQSNLSPTGHNAYFGNTSTYFPSQR